MTLTVKTGLATQKQSDLALILQSGRGVLCSRFTVHGSPWSREALRSRPRRRPRPRIRPRRSDGVLRQFRTAPRGRGRLAGRSKRPIFDAAAMSADAPTAKGEP